MSTHANEHACVTVSAGVATKACVTSQGLLTCVLGELVTDLSSGSVVLSRRCGRIGQDRILVRVVPFVYVLSRPSVSP